jgi:hypothetical protein
MRARVQQELMVQMRTAIHFNGFGQKELSAWYLLYEDQRSYWRSEYL